MAVESEPINSPEPPESPVEPGEQGGPGLSWTGDGALAAAGRASRPRSPLDVEFEVYPPILEQGDEGFPLASFNRRWVGFIIDTVVIAACVLVITFLVGTPETADAEATAQSVVIATLVRLGYGVIFNPRGWSPGKLVMGLRIVNTEGDPPGLRYGVVRTAATVFSEIFYIGYLWAFFDRHTQTWHDKFARTYVVHIEGERPAPEQRGWQRR
jgi:uncharacterized RDD family membrane protein YckC